MDTATLLTFSSAMFAILNPIGSVAIFTSMVANRSKADQRSIALRSSTAVALILIVTVWSGELVLGVFNVGISSFRLSVD